jgi:hypothetical protein
MGDQVSKYVVRVMTGGFQSYFYFGKVIGYTPDSFHEFLKALSIVCDDEWRIEFQPI